MAAPSSALATVQSLYAGFGSPSSVNLVMSLVNDATVFVSEGQGASPLNNQWVGVAGVQAFFATRAQTELWELFEAKNFIPMADPNIVLVLGRAVGSVAGLPKAEWHFTHIWMLDAASGKFRSLESQWRVAYWDSQNVFGGARALVAPAPGAVPVAAGPAAAAAGAAEKKDDKKEKKEKKKDKDEEKKKDEKKDKKDKKDKK